MQTRELANIVAMLLLPIAAIQSAASATAADRLKAIPLEFWLRACLAILAIAALVFFLRKVVKMNKVVLAVVTFIVVTVVGFNWIWERSEPAWATPMVNFLANWFPTKGPPPKAMAKH